MSFYTAREVKLNLNGHPIYANSVSLSQSASLSNPKVIGESVSTKSIANGPVKNQLDITYYLTGRDPLKDYIVRSHKTPMSGNICGMKFHQGFVQSYSLNAAPNSPILIQASVAICDEVSGNFSPSVFSSPQGELDILNFNDSRISDNTFSFTSIGSVTEFSWSYSASVEPIYHFKQTGLSHLNPDRVVVGEKSISCTVVSDNTNLPLPYSGNNFGIDLTCYHPTNSSIYETYSVSGKVSRKDFSVSTNQVSQSKYTISQSHVNELPKIDVVETFEYYPHINPFQDYILIHSPNFENGYFSSLETSPLVDGVSLADRDLKFEVSHGGGGSFDSIIAHIPNDAINGQLQVKTSKGLIVYPSPIVLDYPPITVSGFYPITGAEHGVISISGSNFYRISSVKFNGADSVFQIVDNTGSVHKINAYVPNGASIGKILVSSFQRVASGYSTGFFYPAMDITSFSPATGTWSGTCVLSGTNFTGITNVYFNKIRSQNFTVNNNNQITARIPGTGAGFTKGYISVSGILGMSAKSHTIYQPILKITGVSTLSGRPDNDIEISGIFDSGFLYSENGGYRVAFGNEYATFYRKNGNSSTVITGYIPTGSFLRANPAMVEPDGFTRYPKFTGEFLQIAKPIVTHVNGQQAYYFTPKYHREDLVLRGQNLNNFFGVPYYVTILGYHPNGDFTVDRYSNIEYSDDGTTMIVKNVRMTGNLSLEPNSVGASVVVHNYGGSGVWNGYIGFSGSATKQIQNFNYSTVGTLDGYFYPITAPFGFNIYNGVFYPMTLAADNSLSTIGFGHRFGSLTSINSGWIEATFEAPTDIGGLDIRQTDVIANDTLSYGTSYGYPLYMLGALSQTSFLANTGMIQCYGVNRELLFSTGITFQSSSIPSTSFQTPVVATGVKYARIYRHDNEPRYLGFSYVRFLG